MDSYWHSRCLKCSCCQAQLGDIGTSCYTKSGMILCRNDYIRLFGNSGACSACGQSIPASELVMRAQGNVYHLKCFTCSTCRNRLVPGDRFHYINGSLFCEHDRPTALINGHLNSLQSNPLLPDQKETNAGMFAIPAFCLPEAIRTCLSKHYPEPQRKCPFQALPKMVIFLNVNVLFHSPSSQCLAQACLCVSLL
ncbi:hypothetical protein EK904_003393 [Melospiza melodia maxima]|nr:hypothetical protein EK904_003393 [Melospiza melodia maxima]